MEAELADVEIDADLASRLRDAQQAYDEVVEYLDDLKKEIKARYPDADVRGVCGGEEIFTCIRHASTRINSTRLKHDYPEIYDAYARTTTTPVMRVKRWKAAP